MSHTYARFAAAPIGPLLLAGDGGLTLTTDTNGADIERTAISTVGHWEGTHGAELTFWGDADLQAAVGVFPAGSPLSRMVGGGMAGVGWRLDTGQVFSGGVVVAAGLPVVAKGDTVGVRVVLGGAGNVAEFYKGNHLVHSEALVAAIWHFAASLAAAEAATLWAFVNAGQMQAAGPAALAGWQPAPVVVPTVRLSDFEVLSASTDTPANARFEGIIDAAGLSTVAAFNFWAWGGAHAAQGGVATLTLLDADGVLDGLAQQDLAGVPVSVRMGDLGGALDDADDIGRYVIDRLEILSDARKALHLRDAHDDLDELINPGVFLPSVPALAWRTQPVLIGAVASAPVLGANSDGSVGWICDAPLASIAAVLDRGDPMEPGTWSLASDGQQILLEQPPVGPVVTDASSIGANQQPASLQQMLHEICSRVSKSAWSSADAAAIDAATGYAGVGYYAGDAVSARRAIDAVLPSYGAGRWEDADGTIRFARVVDPASVAELAFDIVAKELELDLTMKPDDAPNLSRRMAYQPNARVLTSGELVTDLVDVPVWRRSELTSPWRGQVYSGRPLSPRYAHADTAPPLVSCFWRAQDAQAEIDRVCGLYDRARAFYFVTLRDPALAPKPGQVGRVTYPRYGLQAGKKLLVRRVERNPVTGDITMDLWG
jgi:hypothetical protein